MELNESEIAKSKVLLSICRPVYTLRWAYLRTYRDSSLYIQKGWESRAKYDMNILLLDEARCIYVAM